jgi:hypothetical protein
LDAVLAKYGLKSKGFAVNVISINQKGGQTAYSITNNFFGDTVKSATNFGFEIVTEGNVDWIYVYPKKGVWQSPFVGLDSVAMGDYIYDPGIGVTTTVHGLSLTLENDTTVHPMLLFIPQGVSSKNNPLKVGVRKKDGFFMFGDFNDDEKHYIFHKGKVVAIPNTNKDDKPLKIR